ncbi:MAG: acetate--CoA ligase family protein [Candidatus Aenigmarchaeota archaeon]|nr:acetate--CoA ligase family protein [Candidatus Aenigmarchaeota archaeon]
MKVLLGKDAEKILKGLPVAKSFMVKGEKELKKIKKYPVVMKLVSPQAVHKTEIGGVKIVNSIQEAHMAFHDFQIASKKNKIKLAGVLIQEKVNGREFIIGIKKDPTFGHVIAFGAGGIFVESLKDITFRSCPISDKDAESMISDLKNQWLVTGTRGQKPINVKSLRQVLVKMSNVPKKYKSIEELDANPVISNEKESKLVDVRIVTK